MNKENIKNKMFEKHGIVWNELYNDIIEFTLEEIQNNEQDAPFRSRLKTKRD